MLYLQALSRTDGREVYEMLQRIGANENGFMNAVHGMEFGEFPAWLAKREEQSRGVGLVDWMVPDTVFWLMDGGVPVGQGNLRHWLTDALREGGGHIGYAVDPERRGKGYGKVLLKLLIEEARKMGITEELLVTIDPGNIASRKVAEANGGQLRRETPEHVYYWFVH